MSKKGDRKKGHRVENAFCEILEKNGFVFDKALPNQRALPNFKAPPCPKCFRRPTWTISKKHDHFGTFDVMAKHPEFPDYTLWVQIASNAWKSGKDRIAMEKFVSGTYDAILSVRKRDRMPFEVRLLRKSVRALEWVEFGVDEFFRKRPFLHPSFYFSRVED